MFNDIVIPICSSCKRLRTDIDEWKDSTRFYEEADLCDVKRLSHGICPECIQKLYPEFAKGINASKNKK